MKPNSRAEFEMIEPLEPVIGHAEPGRSEDEYPAAILWVPDPEQRHGWREVYVRRTVTKRRRTVGFGR